MKDQAMHLCEQFNAMHKFESSFWVSATRASGVQKLKDHLFSRSAGRTGPPFGGPSCLRLHTRVLYGAAPLQVPREQMMMGLMTNGQLWPWGAQELQGHLLLEDSSLE